jgi:hypothetical protein
MNGRFDLLDFDSLKYKLHLANRFHFICIAELLAVVSVLLHSSLEEGKTHLARGSVELFNKTAE